jgi:hypothetical protein
MEKKNTEIRGECSRKTEDWKLQEMDRRGCLKHMK